MKNPFAKYPEFMFRNFKVVGWHGLYRRITMRLYVSMPNLFLTVALTLFLCTGIHAGADTELERPGKLFSPSRIPLLEDPERNKWQKPEEVLDALEIEKGDTIADIGAGSGYLTVNLSERAGETGKVYAVDIQQEMLDYINKKVLDKGLKNVTLVLGSMDDPKLPSGCLDIAVLLSTYHEIAQPVDFMKKIRQAMKSQGRLAILEFTSESPIGPPLRVRLPEDIVVRELKEAGFTLTKRHTFLFPYQYFLIFTASGQ